VSLDEGIGDQTDRDLWLTGRKEETI